MAAAVRWFFVLNHSGDEASLGHAVTLGEGQSVTVGGTDGPLAGGPLLATAAITPRGEVQLEPPGAAPVILEAGRRLALGDGWVELLAPPSLESGSPPPPLARWALAFEVRASDRQQPFRFTRATGERFSHGRHDQNALRCPAPTVARKHTEFFVDAQGQLWANDCQSPGGTWLARERQRLAGWTRVPVGVELMSGSGVYTRLLEAPLVQGR